MTRIHRSLLAAPEHRLLDAIARRLPIRVTSDQLTLLAFGGMIVGAGGFATIATHSLIGATAVVVGLAVNWFGDSLDGTLARVRGRQRPRYGYYVDHVGDIAGVAMLMAGMAVSGLMRPLIAAAVLVGYLIVSAESYLATHATGTFRISFAGVGPTELRILLIVGVVLGTGDVWNVGGVLAAAGLAGAFVLSAVRNTWLLYHDDPLPAENTRTAA